MDVSAQRPPVPALSPPAPAPKLASSELDRLHSHGDLQDWTDDHRAGRRRLGFHVPRTGRARRARGTGGSGRTGHRWWSKAGRFTWRSGEGVILG